MLDTSATAGLYVQENSILANPPAGTLFRLTEPLDEPPTVTLGGVKLVVTNAEFGMVVGVAEGAATTVGTGVFVGLGTLVLVGTGSGVLVAVGTAAGLLAGFPGKVKAFISWMFLNPSPSESRFSINPKAAVFLPLALYAAPKGFKFGILAVWQRSHVCKLEPERMGYLETALLKSPGAALPICGSVEAIMTESNISVPAMINMTRFKTRYCLFVFFIFFSFDWYKFWTN